MCHQTHGRGYLPYPFDNSLEIQLREAYSQTYSRYHRPQSRSQKSLQYYVPSNWPHQDPAVMANSDATVPSGLTIPKVGGRTYDPKGVLLYNVSLFRPDSS
jgi:hypothetical protein